jgi:hypothetical protein
MALGTTISMPRSANGQVVAPTGRKTVWTTVIAAGGPAIQDNATLTTPDTQITNATTSIFEVELGTQLAIRLGYNSSLSSITSPVIRVYGRTNIAEGWHILATNLGSLTLTLTTAATDPITSGFRYTSTKREDWIDCVDCRQILIGIQTALAGTGTVNTSIIQVKAI